MTGQRSTRRLLARLTRDEGLPDRAPLPRHLAPVPRSIENLGLRLGWLVVAINLAGTAFGFYYYSAQLQVTPWPMLPFVPDSPLATLLFALALASWLRGNVREWLCALAFVGNVVLGAWTPIVLVVFRADYATHPAMWQFLFWSHLAMVLQAFVLQRIADFPPRAVGVAVLWYGVDLVVDFFVPVLGDRPHHTALPVHPDQSVALGATARDVAATSAVLLTLVAVYLALTIGIAKREARREARRETTRSGERDGDVRSDHGSSRSSSSSRSSGH